MKLLCTGFSDTRCPFWQSVEEGVKSAGFEYYYYPVRTVMKRFLDELIKDNPKLANNRPALDKIRIDKTQLDLIKTIQEFRPDIVIVFKADYIYLKTIKAIRGLVKRLIYWTYDDPYWITRGRANIKEKAMLCDSVWTTCENSRLYYIKELKVPESILLFPGCNPKYHRDVSNDMSDKDRKHYSSDVCFAGKLDKLTCGKHPNRIILNTKLIDIAERHKFNYKLWGGKIAYNPSKVKDKRTSKYLMPWVPEPEISKVFSNAKICVNLRKLDVPTDKYFDAKTFQIMASGSLLLTYQENKITELFGHMHEFVVWKDFNDLENKIIYFLKNEDHRKRIALAGQQAVYQRFNLANNLKNELERLKVKWAETKSYGRYNHASRRLR